MEQRAKLKLPRSLAEALRTGFTWYGLAGVEGVPNSWPLPTMGNVEALLAKKIEPGISVFITVPFTAKYTFERPKEIWTEDFRSKVIEFPLRNHAA